MHMIIDPDAWGWADAKTTPVISCVSVDVITTTALIPSAVNL